MAHVSIRQRIEKADCSVLAVLDLRLAEAESNLAQLQKQRLAVQIELEQKSLTYSVGRDQLVRSGRSPSGVEAASSSPIRPPLLTAASQAGARIAIGTQGGTTVHFAKTFAGQSFARQGATPAVPAPISPREYAGHWGKATHWQDAVSSCIGQARPASGGKVQGESDQGTSLETVVKASTASQSQGESQLKVTPRKSVVAMGDSIRNSSTAKRSDRIRALENLVTDADPLCGKSSKYISHHVRAGSRSRTAQPEYVGYLAFASAADFAEAMQQRGQPMSCRPQRCARAEGDDAIDQIVESTGTLACLVELARLIAGGEIDPPRLAKLGHIFELRAYELRPNDALRALALITEGACQLETLGHKYARDCTSGALTSVMVSDRVVATLRTAAQRIMAAISTQLQQGLWEKGLCSGGQAGTARLCADALMAMAITKTGRQEQLDALLSQLLLLLRRQPEIFTPPLVATIAVALGRAFREGGVYGCALSAHEGSDDSCAQGNRRFLAAFNIRLLEVLPIFQSKELADVIETYASPYLEEAQWSQCLLVAEKPFLAGPAELALEA